MTENRLDRKPKVIFSVDVKGYSCLTGENEAHTIRTITAFRKTIFGLVSQHKGRVADSPGDNIPAEFSGTFNAVSSAQDIPRIFS